METVWGISGGAWALLGAATAMILGGVGSAIGVTLISNVAAGIISEQPNRFGALVALSAMPGTQGVYGFISALLVLVFFNILGGEGLALNGPTGLQIFMSCLPVGFTCLFSAIYQGKTAIGASGMIATRGEVGKALIFPALVETYAVFSLIVTIVMLLSVRATIG